MQWSQWVALISGTFATVLNLALLPLILIFSSEKIGAYKYCLLFYTMTAALMTICQINTLAAWYAPPNGYIFYVTMPVYPIWLQFIFLYGYIASFLANLMIICWSFFTRLCTLTGSEIFQLPLKPQTILLALGAVALYILLLLDVSIIHRTDENANLFTPTIREISEIELKDVAFIAAPVTINGYLNWRITVSLGIMSSYFMSVSICVSICWWKIGSRLERLRRLQTGSSFNLKIQNRLYILLSFQALFPLFFNTTPACLALLVGLTQLDLGNIIIFCGATLSFAQILDPIFTFSLVSDYRRGLLKLLGLQKSRIYDATSASGQDTHASGRALA